MYDIINNMISMLLLKITEIIKISSSLSIVVMYLFTKFSLDLSKKPQLYCTPPIPDVETSTSILNTLSCPLTIYFHNFMSKILAMSLK